jgi:hypothetical protein
MALENLVGTDKYIANLVPGNPSGGDDKREGDDHIRGIKNVLRNTFPNVDGAVTATDEQLNSTAIDRVAITGDVMTGTLRVPAGTAALPGLKVGTPDVGLFWSASGLAFTTGGVEKARVTPGPEAQLLVGASAAVNGAGGRGLIELSGAAGAYVGFLVGGNGKGYLYATSAAMALSGAAVPLNIGVNGNATIAIDVTNVASYAGAEIGWRDIPIRGTAIAYTLTVADRGSCVSQNAASAIIVNGGVFPIGSVVTIYNNAGVNIGITQGTGMTIRWGAPPVTPASRTLAYNGTATLLFLASGIAVLTGTGIS